MILVTGANGFVGQHLVRFLSSKKSPVVALYHHNQPSQQLMSLPYITWEKVDLLDVFAIENVLEPITQIYHCAALVSFDPKRKRELLQTNIESTSNLINAALEKGIEKFVHLSSTASLGSVLDTKTLITEEDQWEDIQSKSNYSLSKYESEMEVWRGIGEGLNAVILNPGIILGFGDWNKGSCKLFKNIFQKFPFYTKGINGWVAVEDVVQLMYLLMQSDISSERFIAIENNYSYRTIFDCMANGLKVKPPFIYASKIATKIVAQFFYWKNIAIGKEPTITPETAKTATSIIQFSNRKILSFFPEFQFIPIENAIENAAKEYLKIQ